MPLPMAYTTMYYFQYSLNWLDTPANDVQYPGSPTHDLSTTNTHAVVTEIMPTHSGAVIANLYSFLCTGGAYYVPYSFLLISNKFCNGGQRPEQGD
jgi:hypothetical protein